MIVRKLFAYIFTFFIIASVIINFDKTDEALGIAPNQIKSYVPVIPDNPEFLHLGAGHFKTVGSIAVYPDDCPGCGELGDIDVSYDSESIEMTNYIVNANCNGKLDVVEKGFQLNEKGEIIGQRCIVIFPNGVARIVWTENEKDNWMIHAPNLELALKFEKSEIYRKNKMAAKLY